MPIQFSVSCQTEPYQILHFILRHYNRLKGGFHVIYKNKCFRNGGKEIV